MYFNLAIVRLQHAEHSWLRQQLDWQLLEAAADHAQDGELLQDLPQDERQAAFADSLAKYAEGLEYTSDRPDPRELVLLKWAHDPGVQLRYEFVDDPDPSPETSWGLYMRLYSIEPSDRVVEDQLVALVQGFIKRFRPRMVFTGQLGERPDTAALVITGDGVRRQTLDGWIGAQQLQIERQRQADTLAARIADETALEEAVLEQSEKEASDVLNAGLAAQIEFLLERMTVDEVRRLAGLDVEGTE